jgi:hypothetical protein
MKYQPLVNQFLLPILREPPTPNVGYKSYLGRSVIGGKPAISEDNQKQEESNHSESQEEPKLSNH